MHWENEEIGGVETFRFGSVVIISLWPLECSDKEYVSSSDDGVDMMNTNSLMSVKIIDNVDDGNPLFGVLGANEGEKI